MSPQHNLADRSYLLVSDPSFLQIANVFIVLLPFQNTLQKKVYAQQQNQLQMKSDENITFCHLFKQARSFLEFMSPCESASMFEN